VDIVWDLHEDFSVAGFNVYGRPSGSNSWSQLNSSLVQDTLYTDTIVTNGSTYEYAVSAVDHDGNEGEKSAADAATPQAASPTTLSARLSPDEKGRVILTSSGSPYTVEVNSGALADNGTLYIAPGTELVSSGTFTIRQNTRVRGTQDDPVVLGAQLNFASGTLEMLYGQLGKSFSPRGAYTIAYTDLQNNDLDFNYTSYSPSNFLSNQAVTNSGSESVKYLVNNSYSNSRNYVSDARYKY